MAIIYGVTTMKIAYSFSPNWFKHILVELFALFSNNSPPIKVYLLSDQLTKWQINQLKFLKNLFGDGYTIDAIAIPVDYFTPLNQNNIFTKYALYRLLLPFVTEEDKILYLDTDTLVINSICELYNLDLKDNFLAAAEDINIENFSTGMKESIGFAPDEPYINSGVTLLNLKLMRETGKAEELLNSIQKDFYPVCPDQTLLNKLCQGKIQLINRYYNTCYATFLSEPIVKKEIKIMHYIGNKTKNWVYDMEFSDLWEHWENKWRAI